MMHVAALIGLLIATGCDSRGTSGDTCGLNALGGCLGSTRISGSVGGYDFACVQTAAFSGPFIVLSSAQLADSGNDYAAHRNSRSMEFYALQLAPGSYAADAQHQVYFHAYGDQCEELISGLHVAMSGSFTFDAISPNVIGSFDLTFALGRLTGRFEAAPCSSMPSDGGSRCR